MSATLRLRFLLLNAWGPLPLVCESKGTMDYVCIRKGALAYACVSHGEGNSTR
jgi:hypothetical protein